MWTAEKTGMAGLVVTRSFLAAALIFFSLIRGGSFSRGRAENFIVELEAGSENKESCQGKIVLIFFLNPAYVFIQGGFSSICVYTGWFFDWFRPLLGGTSVL